VGGKKYRLEGSSPTTKYVIAEGVAPSTAHRQGRREERLDPRGAVAKARGSRQRGRCLGLDLAYAEGLVSPRIRSLPVLPGTAETTTFWKWIKEHQPQIKRVARSRPRRYGLVVR